MLTVGETACGANGNSLCYLHNFSVNLKLFYNKNMYLKKKNQIIPHLLGITVVQIREPDPLSQSFGPSGLPQGPLPLATQDFFRSGYVRTERRKKWVLPYSLWVRAVPFPVPGATAGSFFWSSLFMLMLASWLQAALHSAGEHWRKNCGKHTSHLVVQIRIFPSLPAAIYFSESLKSCSMHSESSERKMVESLSPLFSFFKILKKFYLFKNLCIMKHNIHKKRA